MPNSIKLIRELLEYVQCYEMENGKPDLKEFTIFLKDKVIQSQPPSGRQEFEADRFREFRSFPEIEFSTLLTGLFRFSKHYIKKAFINTSINTLDEFGFMATLMRDESLLKNELIGKHMLEISSGSEIIKRLIAKGLVQENPDQQDRRAKRVSLTEKGKLEIMNAFNDMHKVSEIIIGNLSEGELTDALVIFNKLTYFHRQIHELDRQTELDELHGKYVLSPRAEINKGERL